MTKKLFIMVFALVAFLFVGTVSVNAVTTIEDVNVINIIEPIEGATPDHMTVLAMPNENITIVNEFGFYKNSNGTDLMDYMVPFVKEDNVYFKLELEPNIGYIFDENTRFMYKGNVINESNITRGIVTKIILPFTVKALYNITINPTTNGTVTGISLTDVISGENRVLTITPDANYMIDKVLVNDIDKTADIADNQLILNVDENKNIVVTFKKIPCKLTINNVTGATITPNGLINLENGDNQDVTITANAGYKLKSVKVNGEEKLSTLTGNKLKLINITQDTEVVVVAEKIVYNILEGKDLKTSDLTKLTLRIDADYSKFITGGKVFVDDFELNSTQYTSESGSTIITLAESFAKLLSKGLHKIKVIFNDGAEVTTNFTIENEITTDITKTEPDNQETPTTPSKQVEKNIANPKTGDNIVMYSIVFVVALLGIITFIVVNKRKKVTQNNINNV